MVPCKDCLIFPMCLAYTKTQEVVNNAVLFIAVRKCSLLYEYIYDFTEEPNHYKEVAINKENYANAINHFFDFGYERI